MVLTLVGANVDQGNILNANYGAILKGLNSNHIRLFPWTHFDPTNATYLNQLKTVLDTAWMYGLRVTVVLSLREWKTPTGALGRTFIRGYPVPKSWNPSDPLVPAQIVGDIELAKADFLSIFNVIGNHPALHSWEMHNEPWKQDWEPTVNDPNYSAYAWLTALKQYISSVDNQHPVYVGLTMILDNRAEMFQDCANFCDILAFHYYVNERTNGEYWDAIRVAQEITLGTTGHTTGLNYSLASHMNLVRQVNTRNLPVWIDECGMPSSPSTEATEFAYTDLNGQAVYYDTLLKEVKKYPDITSFTFWCINVNNRYSILNANFTEKPAANVIRTMFKSASGKKYLFKHWQDGDTNPTKNVQL
jgi:hypothetical protein